MGSSPVSSKDLNQLCDRFRVLIIGRRNAGKTTILENMTGSEEGAKPVIRDKEGRMVVRGFPHISNINSQADGLQDDPTLVKAGLEVRRIDEHLHLFSRLTNKFSSVG
jgi:GTPase SAR1 family protein